MTGEIARLDAAFAARSTALMAARATDAAGPSAKIIPFHRSSAVANHAAGGNPGGVWTARPAGDQDDRAAALAAAGERLRRLVGRVFPAAPLALADDLLLDELPLGDLPNWPDSVGPFTRALVAEFYLDRRVAIVAVAAARTLGDLAETLAEAGGP